MTFVELFNSLESARKTTSVQFSLFSDTPQTNADYWLMSDLCRLFKNNMPRISDMNERYAFVLKSLGEIPEKYSVTVDTIPYDHIIPITSKGGNKIYDMQLSRYAAFAMCAKRPLLSYQSTYFMLPGADADKVFNTSLDIARTNIHEKLLLTNRRIAGMLKQNNINPKEFYANVYNVFFGQHNITDIKQQHRIPIIKDDSIQHYMGATQIYEFSRALESIRSEFDICKNRTPNTLSYITTKKMQDARRAVYATLGQNPEQVITNKSIMDIRNEARKAEQTFIGKFQSEKLRVYSR